MKKLLIILFIIPIFTFAQTTEEFDFIAPFSDGFAAVKKGDLWGFINKKGNIVIAFRDDLVLTETDGYKYPVFKNNRCLTFKDKDGITYFGYIDEKGNTVIEHKFLNASNFNNNTTIALYVLKEKLGENEILEKNVVTFRYYEVIINTNGDIEHYLNPKGVNVILDKKFLRKPPKITSVKLSDNIYAVRSENKKWKLVKIKS